MSEKNGKTTWGKSRDTDKNDVSLERAQKRDDYIKRVKITEYNRQNDDFWNETLANETVQVLEIETERMNPDFLKDEQFYKVLSKSKNLFFVDIKLPETTTSSEPDDIATRLQTIAKAIIIQLIRPSSTKVYVKDHSTEIFIINLNDDAPELTEETLVTKLSSSVDMKLIIEAVQSEIVGKFENTSSKSLREVHFKANTFLGKRKLIDYAVRLDSTLCVRFLMMYDWPLITQNEAREKTFEIAAANASVDTLAAMLDLSFPLPEGTFKLSEDQIRLLNLKDRNHDTPLLIAVKNNRDKVVKFLAQCGVDLHSCGKDEQKAIDIAWNEGYYSVMETLLHADSDFPKEFNLNAMDNDEEIPHTLKSFVHERQRFHENIRNKDMAAVSNYISKYNQLRFPNIQNQLAVETAWNVGTNTLKIVYDMLLTAENQKTADFMTEMLKTALSSKPKRFDVYSFLQSLGITFKSEEDHHEYIKKLDPIDKLLLQKALDIYFTPLPDAHIMFLVLRSAAAKPFHNFADEDAFKQKVDNYFRSLSEHPDLDWILRVVATRHSGLEKIIFDFDRVGTIGTNTSGSHTECGQTNYNGGIINIGAKTETSKLLGTLIHELTHFAVQRIYSNDYNPYDIKDEIREREYSGIVKSIADRSLRTEAKSSRSKLHDTIKNAFINYESYLWHSEAIVRIPHILGECIGKRKESGDTMINFEHNLSEQVPELLKYFTKKLLPDCRTFVEERNLIEPRNNLKLLNPYLGVLSKIEKAGIEFDENTLASFESALATNFNFVVVETCNVFLSMCLIHQSLKNGKQDAFLFLKMDQFQEPVRLIFKSELVDFLAIEYPQSLEAKAVEKLLNQLDAVFSDMPNKKVIIVTDKPSNLGSIAWTILNHKMDRKCFKVKHEDFTLSDLTEKSQQKILGKTVIFQGSEIVLKELVCDETLKEAIDADRIFEIVSGEKMTIGKAVPGLGELENYYIERDFIQDTEVSTDIFKSTGTATSIIAVSGIDKESLNRIIPGGVDDEKVKFLEDYRNPEK